MNDATRSRLFDELIAAAEAMRAFLDEHPDGEKLDARGMHTMERLVERYHRADDALSKDVERVIKRSSTRPRH